MNDLNNKFEAVENLIHELRERCSTEPEEVDQLLAVVSELIRSTDSRPRTEQDISLDLAELEPHVEEGTDRVLRDNAALRSQIGE